jgi:hypothetical protein
MIKCACKHLSATIAQKETLICLNCANTQLRLQVEEPFTQMCQKRNNHAATDQLAF